MQVSYREKNGTVKYTECNLLIHLSPSYCLCCLITTTNALSVPSTNEPLLLKLSGAVSVSSVD